MVYENTLVGQAMLLDFDSFCIDSLIILKLDFLRIITMLEYLNQLVTTGDIIDCLKINK